MALAGSLLTIEVNFSIVKQLCDLPYRLFQNRAWPPLCTAMCFGKQEPLASRAGLRL